MKKIFALLFIANFLCATRGPQVQSNTTGFYNPWYTGSIFSTSGVNVPPGMYIVQGYVFVRTQYGIYDPDFKLIPIDNVTEISPVFLYQCGLTNWMDFEIIIESSTKITQGKWGTNIKDLSALVGFQLYRTSENNPIPDMRLFFLESFPTGNYRNLDPKKLGTDSTGTGSFISTIGLSLQKACFKESKHPTRFRFNALFEIPSKAKVKGFNSYGGGYGTNGRVFSGYKIYFLLSPEVSLNQKWAFACDFIYRHIFEGSFKGNSGMSASGLPASIYTTDADIVTMAPSIEYNINASLGMFVGGWFTLAGRNLPAFYSGVYSLTYVF